MRRLVLGALLLVVWLMLWDGITPGSVIGGMAVVTALLLVLNPSERGGATPTFNPLAAFRLLVWFSGQFVLSNFQVARAVLAPGRFVDPRVVRVQLHHADPTLMAIVSNLSALAPGMQPVDGSDQGEFLDVHVLVAMSDEEVAGVVHRLESFVAAVLGRELNAAPGDGTA